LPGRRPGKRQAGWPSLLVTFLLATQEKSNSSAVGDRKLLLTLLLCSEATPNQKASRLKSLLQTARASRTGCAPTGGSAVTCRSSRPGCPAAASSRRPARTA
jgi:hypothetical protein